MLRKLRQWFRDLLAVGRERVRLASMAKELEVERAKYRIPTGHFNPGRQRERRREFMYRHPCQPALQRSGR